MLLWWMVVKMKLRSFFGFFDWLQQLDWRRVKVKPFVKSIQMPLNVFQDKDGLPRIVLTDPNGSSAEVGLFIIFFVKEKLDKQFIKQLYHKCL
jgi:hypothetical protein